MDLSSILKNVELLQFVKTVLFICGFLFGAAYSIPRGIILYGKWKETKKKNDLSSAVTFFAGGILILIYLAGTMLIDFLR